MTSKELDERIDGIGKDYWHDGITSQSRDDVKQLIRDVIESVTPVRKEVTLGMEYQDHSNGFNSAVDTIEANSKELLA